MRGSLVTDDDYITDTESAVPRWRHEALESTRHTRLSAKYRSQHSIQWPDGGSILITFPLDAEEPRWLRPVMELLSGLAQLPKNWDSYGAHSISLHSAAGVLRLLSMLMTDAMPLPTFVPVRTGGIQVEWHTKGVDLEVQVSPTGLSRASFEDSRRGTEWVGDVTSNLGPLRGVLARLTGPAQ